MNEEEKKVIEELSKKAVICNYEERDYPNMICFKKDMIIALNLIEKLQKENEKYKRLAKINLKNAEEFKDNMCEHRCLLKSENEELKARLDELSKNNFQLYIKRDKQMEEIIENKIKKINEILENKSYFNLAERDKLEYAKYLYENLLTGGDDSA